MDDLSDEPRRSGGRRAVQDVRAAVSTALRHLPLKDMDPSLLYISAMGEGTELGVDVTRLSAAMELAAYLHRDDIRSRRKSLPVDTYVTHPFRLVLRLIRYGCADDSVLCAAALHDTVEDHPVETVALLGGTEAEPRDGAPQEAALGLLSEAFGADVARMVAAVTNRPGAAAATEEERQHAYRQHVADSIADPQVFLVKLADLVDNAGSLRYLADEDRRARLTRKYAPLVPTFEAALDAHRSSLPIGPDGLAQIRDHLGALSELGGPGRGGQGHQQA